jgi:SAM-dependent methyltransferase
MFGKICEQYWQHEHIIDNICTLTGSSYARTLEFLALEHRVQDGCRSLEIGVGQGHVIKGLAQAGEVCAIDICDAALAKVESFCQQVWLTDQCHDLPHDYFDVVICRNTTKHIWTSQLEKLMDAVIKSLRADGVFAFDFVWSNRADTPDQLDRRARRNPHFGAHHTQIIDNGKNPPPEEAYMGRLYRSTEFMSAMVRRLGGVPTIIKSVPIIDENPRNDTQHPLGVDHGITVMHVQRRRQPVKKTMPKVTKIGRK